MQKMVAVLGSEDPLGGLGTICSPQWEVVKLRNQRSCRYLYIFPVSLNSCYILVNTCCEIKQKREELDLEMLLPPPQRRWLGSSAETLLSVLICAGKWDEGSTQDKDNVHFFYWDELSCYVKKAFLLITCGEQQKA